jgi:hypothetical protein
MKTKLLLILTLTGCFLCGNIFAAGDPANLGTGFISNVTAVNGECVQSTINGQTQKWDIQANGTYMVTLSGVTDCANGGNDPSIQVIVKNSGGGNICVATANQTATGIYVFQVALTTQCQTLPILYCTSNCDPSTGLFARDALAGHEGHLRTSTFDAGCTNPVADDTCNGGATPTPTPLPKASITACKFYDQNADGTKQASEPYLAGWPIGICPLDGAPEDQTQITGVSGCVTWTNLTIPGDYTVTEADALESNWFHSPDPLPPPLIVGGSSRIVFPTVGETGQRTFGNYCTSPSGGLTLGFWSNKNGNKILTANANGTGATLLPAVVTLLNSCHLVNANGSLHTFTSSYSAFRTWLLGATATNMAYMLSAQLATLKLDLSAPTGFGSVDSNAYDLCSHMTVNGLISTACDQLAAPGGNYTISGDPTRLAEEMLKNCIDAINNNGDVVPVTPCPHTFASPTPCP